MPHLILGVGREKVGPLLISHSIVGESTGKVSNEPSENTLAGVEELKIGQRKDAPCGRGETYQGKPHEIVVQLEIGKADGAEAAICAKGDDQDGYAQESPDLAVEDVGLGSGLGRVDGVRGHDERK